MPKTVAYILLSTLFGTTVLAQSPDSAFHRFGVFGDYDGSFFDYAGLKYRVTPEWASYVRIRVAYSDNTEQPPSSQRSNAQTDLELALGLERGFISIERLSMFVYGSFGYNYHKSKNTYYVMPAGTMGTRNGRSNSYILTLGIGAEYSLSPQLSFALRNSAAYRWHHGESGDSDIPMNNSSSQSERIELGLVHATFTFYF